MVLITFLFLANLRAGAITLTAIPLSLSAAVLVLQATGASINTMTLGGMAIAIGALVDDAIVDVENVVRRLRENHGKPEGVRLPAAVVIRDATLEIRSSIVVATAIIVMVFLPAFGLAGVEGRLLAPLALSYIVALLASLVVAIVVTPALSAAFLPGARSIEAGRDGWLARRLRSGFARLLPAVVDRPAMVLLSAGLAFAVAVVALSRAGTAFLPEFHESSLTVQANTLPGTSLAKSDEIGRRVERMLLAQPEVVATARRTGRAEFDEHVQGVEAAEIDVGLREGRPRDVLLAALRREFSTLPGTNVTIGQPISHRIDHMLSGTRANIAVKVFGDDLATLQAAGRARPGGDGHRPWRRRSVARAADGRAVRPLRAQPADDRPLRTAAGRRGRGDRNELRRRDRRPRLRSRHRLRSGGEAGRGVERRFRSPGRSADRHAGRRGRSGAGAGRRAS